MMPVMYGDYRISIEPIEPCLEQTMALWKAHWDEQGEEAARGLPFNPDVAQFIDCEKRRYFLYITVRHHEQLVGHFGLSFGKNKQTSLWVAGDDFMYLMPEHRKGMLAVKLIRFAAETAFSNQAVEFGISYRTFGSTDLDVLLRRCKFRQIANVYSLRRDHHVLQ